MQLTDSEKRTIRVVFGELLFKPYSELNTFLGSLTIEEMRNIYRKLRYEKYCEDRGITVDEMTDDDPENAAYEEIEAYEQEAGEDY